jgi:hypothetical protein
MTSIGRESTGGTETSRAGEDQFSEGSGGIRATSA